MADFAVNTAFTANDRVSGFFKKAGKNAGLFGDKATRSFRKASKAGSTFQGVFKGILAAGAVRRGFAIAERGIADVVRQFIILDDSLVAASSKFSDVNRFTLEGRRLMDELRVSARELGATTEFTATEAAQGLDFLALAGFNARESMSLLPSVVDLATATALDLARTTDIASDVMGQFNFVTEDSIQLQKNWARQNEALSFVTGETNTTLEELFEAMKTSAIPFRLAGESIETVTSLLGILAAAGAKGSLGGTAARVLLSSLTKRTPAASKALEDLGVKIADANDDFRGTVIIMGELQRALKGMGTAKQLDILGTIFGRRGLTPAGLLITKGEIDISAFIDKANNSMGSLAERAAFVRTSFGNKIKAMTSASIEFGFKILEAFETRGKGAVDRFTEAIRNVDVQPIVNILEDLFTAFVNIGKGLQPMVGRLLPRIVELLTALGAVLVFLSPILPEIVAAWIAYKTAVGAVALAQTLLNIAMTANPIALIITGIVALVIAGIVLVKNWGKIKTVFIDVWKFIQRKFADIVGGIIDLFAGILKAAMFAGRAVGDFFGFNTSGIDNAIAAIENLQRKAKEGLATQTVITEEAKIAAALRSRDFDFLRRGGESPNAAQIRNRSQFGFEGTINVLGLPEGSTVNSVSTGGANVEFNQLGVNP